MSNNLQIDGVEVFILWYFKINLTNIVLENALRIKETAYCLSIKRNFKIKREKNRRETFDALSLKTYGEIYSVDVYETKHAY